MFNRARSTMAELFASPAEVAARRKKRDAETIRHTNKHAYDMFNKSRSTMGKLFGSPAELAARQKKSDTEKLFSLATSASTSISTTVIPTITGVSTRDTDLSSVAIASERAHSLASLSIDTTETRSALQTIFNSLKAFIGEEYDIEIGAELLEVFNTTLDQAKVDLNYVAYQTDDIDTILERYITKPLKAAYDDGDHWIDVFIKDIITIIKANLALDQISTAEEGAQDSAVAMSAPIVPSLTPIATLLSPDARLCYLGITKKSISTTPIAAISKEPRPRLNTLELS